MRRYCPILLAMSLVFITPLSFAGGHHHHEGIHMSHHTSFDVDGDLLVISHSERNNGDEVIVSQDGHLTINGEGIEVDRKDRRLLKKLFAESVKLEKKAELIAEDAEDIAEEATAFASAAVISALKSLANDDYEQEDEYSSLEADFEERIELIENLGDEIGDQAEQINDLAELLRERIPELNELEWFLDD